MSQVLHHTPLFRTAWRRLLRRPFQYVLFVLGVALGVAMMVSIDLANGSASRAFALSADSIAGRTTHRIVGGPTGLDETLYRQIRTDIGYRRAAPIVSGVVLSDQLGDEPYQLIGVDAFAEPPFRSYLGGAGAGSGANLAGFIGTRNGVLISAEIANDHALELGDTIELSIAGTRHETILVGMIESNDELTQRGLQGLIFADIASAQEMLGRVGTLDRIDLIADSDADLTPIRALLPPDVTIETAAAQGNAIQQMTAAFELNLTALSLLALVVGMFLIYNTVTFSVVQRRPLFGVLRCLGVTGGQLAFLILGEAALLGLIGSLIGVGLGIILGQGMVRLVTQTINDLYFTVTVREVAIPAWSLIKGVGIGVFAALIASAVPAWEAMKTSPNATLRRSTLESKINNLLPYLVGGWVVLGGCGAFLLWVEGGLITAFTGLFAVLFAFALLTPPVTVLMMRLLLPLTAGLLGAIGRIAPRDIIRSLSRTSIAIAALMMSVSVIVGVSIMIGSFRQTVVQWLDQTLQADIFLSPLSVSNNRVDGVLDAGIVAQAADWDGVERIVTARLTTIFAPEWEQFINVAAVNGDVSKGERPYLWKSAEIPQLWQQLDAGAGVLISEPLLRRQNLSIPPEPITLQTPTGPRTLPILGVFYDYGSDQGLTYIGSDLYREIWQDESISTAGLIVQDGADVDAIVDDMQAAFTPIQTVNIRSNVSLRETSIEIFDRTFAITAALRLLATVVAFIGVLSALMSLQLERARELGTLRATGMTRGQLWALTLLETGLMGAVAGIIAMPTGYILAWILIYVINLRSFGWTLGMELEPSYFGQAFLVAIIAALLAGIYPAWKIGRMVIASALRSD